MMKKMLLSLAMVLGLMVSPVLAGPPSPPCSGCGGTPSVPKPLYFLQPQALVTPPVKNAMEWDGSSLWLTTLGGVRLQATIPTTGIVGTQLSNPFTWPNTYAITMPDGSTWDSTGLSLSKTLISTGLITANGGLTVPSGQTETVAGTLDVNGTITIPPATASGQAVQQAQIVHNSIITTVPVRNTVTVYPPAWNGGNPYVIDPFNNIVDTSGTTTDGIQEAINYAIANKYNVHIAGSSNAGYSATTTISIGASQSFEITSDNTYINISPGTATDAGIQIDSQDKAVFKFNCLITYSGNGIAVWFHPLNESPASTYRIQYSEFHFLSIVDTSGTSTSPIIQLDTSGNSAASIIYSNFNFVQIYGGSSTDTLNTGILVSAPNDGFSFNEININTIHGYITNAVQEGGTSTDYVYANNWYVNFQTAVGSSIVMTTYAAFSKGQLTYGQDSSTGNFAYYIAYLGKANSNQFDVYGANNIPTLPTNPINQESSNYTNKTNLSVGWSQNSAITVGASPFTFTNTYQTPIYVNITGGSGVSIAIMDWDNSSLGNNGTVSGTYMLPPGFSVKVTYTTAPTMSYLYIGG